MAKLYFRYGAMNSGKSTALLQVAYNYEERGQRVLLAKPLTDTKGDAQILSRLGVAREVDFLIGSTDNVQELFSRHARGYDPNALVETVPEIAPVAALLVDEAQFLTGPQVEDLLRIATYEDVPVLTYGLRTDFQTQIFPGSQRLLALAHALEELKTICRCGRKAILNGRRIGGQFIFSGDQVSIDGDGVTYESLCAQCYLRESGGSLG